MQEREEIKERNPLPEKQIFQNVRETEVTVPEDLNPCMSILSLVEPQPLMFVPGDTHETN